MKNTALIFTSYGVGINAFGAFTKKDVPGFFLYLFLPAAFFHMLMNGSYTVHILAPIGQSCRFLKSGTKKAWVYRRKNGGKNVYYCRAWQPDKRI